MWKKKPRENDDDPIKRIFNTILEYAINQDARQICIELRHRVPTSQLPDSDKFVVVCYLFGEEWKEQMNLPFYVYYPLFAEIRRRSAMDETQNIGEIVMPLRDESNGFNLKLRVAVELTEDKATLLRPRFSNTD